MMSLAVDGYEIHRGYSNIDTNILEYMTEYAKKAEPIFNDNTTNRQNDRLRRQISLPSRHTWLRDIRQKLQERYPEHKIKDPVLLQSMPGCRRQAAHCDYVPSPEFLVTNTKTKPLLFILALENDTYLDVWSGSHLRKSARSNPILPTRLSLNAGDAIIFRSDLVHAGSAYDKSNIRIHFYIDHPSVPRDPNRTWIIYKHASEVERARIVETV
jgi:hypothetical protein